MTSPLVAVLLSRRKVEASPEDVMAGLHERFPDVSVGQLSYRPDGKRGFGLSVDGVSVVPNFEDRPFDLASMQAWHGHLRDSDGPLLDNAAHVMVGCAFAHDGHRETLRASMAVLKVASVLSECPGVHAVLWTPAFSLTTAGVFRAELAGASEHHAPIGVLTRIGQFQAGTEGGKPLLGVWAEGLALFVERDIEFVPKPLPAYQMFNALASAANWLLLKGPVFEDGDTCGISATERIRVRHRDRGIVIQTPVLLMDIETLDPSATRFAN